MKNIEMPEVQDVFIDFVTDTSMIYGELIYKLLKLGMPNCDAMKRKEWFNSEYVEPHKWEPWELEVLRNLPSIYLYMRRNNDNKTYGIIYMYTDSNNQNHHCLRVNLPSLKQGETINIDEELERNGMHR